MDYRVLMAGPQAALFAAIGLSWLAAYVLVIKRGYQDRVPAMPVVACGLNLAWEFLCAFVYPLPGAAVAVGAVWFALDLAIAAQVSLYARRDLKLERVGPRAFALGLAGVLALTAAAVVTLNVDPDLAGGPAYRALGVPMGHVYASFGQNLVMSASYVAMILRRDGVAGQSLYIAASKMLGTALAVVGMLLYFPPSRLLGFCYAAIVALDAAYVALVYRKCRELSIDPWRRW